MDVQTRIGQLFRDGGLDAEAIAEAVDVPRASVIAILVRDGMMSLQDGMMLGGAYYKPSDEVERASAATRWAIVDGYLNYFPIASLARQHGLTPMQVWEVVTEEGAPVRPPPPPIRRYIRKGLSRAVRAEAAVEWYRAGVLLNDLWLILGISHKALMKMLNERGIPRRNEKAAAAQRVEWDAAWEGDEPEKEMPEWTVNLVNSLRE